MATYTTQQALEQLFSQKTIWRELGIPEGTWYSYHNRFKAGKLSHDKQYEILRLAGYEVKQEMEWGKGYETISKQFLKSRTEPLNDNDIDKWFDEHLPDRLYGLLGHLWYVRNTHDKERNPFLLKSAYTAAFTNTRMFLEFFGLKASNSTGELSKDRKYFTHCDGNSYEVKIIDLGGNWVKVGELLEDERKLLGQAIITGHRSIVHLTYGHPDSGKWEILHEAVKVILRLLESNLYKPTGRKLRPEFAVFLD